MKKRERLSGTERRAGIIDSARRVFAEKGFRGTTTRELAIRAGVSEALLFKHFPSKEALYEAMLNHCRNSEAGLEYQRLLSLPPSTEALALLLHFIALKIITSDDKVLRNIHQLILHSLGEDRIFARVMFDNAALDLVPALRRCVQAARRDGDAQSGESPDAEWLAQHLLLMVSFMHLPGKSLAKYRTAPGARVREVVLFTLRGLGIHEEALRRAYSPRTVKSFGEGRSSGRVGNRE